MDQTALMQMFTAAVQSLRELNAYLRDVKDRGSEGLHAYYAEVRRMIRAVDANAIVGIRPITVPITVNVISAGTGGSGTWKVTEDADFAVHECRGFLSQNDIPSDATKPPPTGIGNAGLAAWTPQDRLLARAQNCKVRIKNNDSTFNVTDTTAAPSTDVVLSSILCEAGGRPLTWGGEQRPAWVVPHGQTLSMTATLSKSSDYLTFGNCDYGVMLTGLLFSRIARG